MSRAAIVSVNVGRPRLVEWAGREVRTGIFKQPVTGRVAVGRVQVDGDGQADLVNHGGELMAVYAYPSEHYPFWRAELGALPDGWGVFGENLSLSGLLEDEVRVGDRLRAGSVVLRVTEPRYPCFKLGLRLGRRDAAARFLAANRTGFYLAVEQEGELGAGDPVELLARDGDGITIAELMRLRVDSGPQDADALRAALALDALTDEWRELLRDRLAKVGGA